MMNLQRNSRLTGALLAALALFAAPALAQDGGDEIGAPAPAPAPVEEAERPVEPAPAPVEGQPGEQPEAEEPVERPVEKPAEIDEGTKKVLEGIERLAGDLGLINERLAGNAEALRALSDQVTQVNRTALAVNLTVRGQLDTLGTLNAKADQVGEGVAAALDQLAALRGGPGVCLNGTCASIQVVLDGVNETRDAVRGSLDASNQLNQKADQISEGVSAALESLARIESGGRGNCSGHGVCFGGRCFCASRLEETTDDTRAGVEAANAKLDLVLGGGDDGVGLSDIYAAADAASKGGTLQCPNNCSGRGVCAFGRCFASAEGIDTTIGTVTAGVAEVNEALSQQGQLAEINAGTLSGIREEVGALSGQLSALRIGIERDEAERAQIRLEKRIGLVIADPTGGFDITTAAADAEIAVRLVGEQLEAYAAVRARLEAAVEADTYPGGRRARRRARRQLRDFDQAFAQATTTYNTARDRLASGDGLGAFLAAKATGNPLHQCAQVTIQVDLGELADVDFE